MRNEETVPVCPSRAIEQFRLNLVFDVIDRFFFVPSHITATLHTFQIEI
jgi:hypothetical protein